MLWSLAWSLPFLLVVAAGVVVTLRAPAGSPWRVPAAAGFVLLAVSQLVTVLQQVVLLTGGFDTAVRAVLTVTGALGALLNLVGTVLLVVAFLRVPRVAALGWGGAPAAVPAGDPYPSAGPGGAYAPPPADLQKAPGVQGPASTQAPRPGAGG